MLKVEIYGRYTCPFCVRANSVFEELKARGEAEGEFFDMPKLGITKEDLSKKAGKTLNTVPQVWVNGEHVGGCDDFLAFLTAKGYAFHG